MNIEDFPLCCGIKVITDFGHTGCTEGDNRDYHEGDDEWYAPDEDEIEGYITRRIEIYKNNGNSMLMAVLNNDQKPIVGPVLEKHGFALCESAPNPKHGASICHLYIHVLNPSKKVGSNEKSQQATEGSFRSSLGSA